MLRNLFKKYSIIVFTFTLIILFYLSLRYAWGYFHLPDQAKLVEITKAFFLEYGLIVIFLASILEALLFIGNYFPGSLVIFLGVAISVGDINRATKTILLTILGMCIGYSINYLLGKYGLYKILTKFGFKSEIDKLKNKISNIENKKTSIFSLFMFYIIPGSGSLLSTAFGILKYNFTKFVVFTLFIVAFWNTLWGILVYNFGMKMFEILTSYISGLIFITLTFIYFIYSGKFDEIKNQN